MLLLVTLSGCYVAGPRPGDTFRENTQMPSSITGGPTTGAPLVDYDMRLAPNDVVGITFISRDTPQGYPLQTGDTLLVEYHQQEHLNRNAVVRPDGNITLPCVGDIVVGGKTVPEVNKIVAELYSMEDIFKSLTITVTLLSFHNKLRELQQMNTNSAYGQTRHVTVSGDGSLRLPLGVEVQAAGRSLNDVSGMIAQAYNEKVPGAEVLTELIEMRHNYLYVLGEVNNPGLVSIGGPMGVAQAVASAGGHKNTADLRTVAVFRAAPDCDAATGRQVDLDCILTTGDLSGDVLVRRFDIVYVPPSTIKNMNDRILMYVRNMMPIESFGNVGVNWSWVRNRGGTTTATTPITPMP
jgi:polysaccharide export outer membrane protein